MKTTSILIFLLLIQCLQLQAQDCIDAENIKQPFQGANFNRDSYITISSPQEPDGMQTYLDEDFTLEFWVYPQWSKSDENWQYIFSYGDWDDDHHSLFVAFESANHSGDHWAIRVSDGNENGSNTDLLWKFTQNDYENNFKEQWTHICITLDSPSDRDSDATVKLYVNGSWKKTQEGFDLKSYTDNDSQKYCYLGENGNHNESFYGYIAGFRLWNQVLSNDARSYVKNKTFRTIESFNDDWDHLYDNLIVNMASEYSNNNIYSTTHSSNGIRMTEHTLSSNSTSYPPTAPPKISNLSKTENCDNITLSWTPSGLGGTHYIWRKESTASSSTIICRTNETSYVDTDVEPGIEYIYTIDARWYEPETEEYSDSENETITAKLKKIPSTELYITEDASNSGNCNGQVKLRWDDITPAPDSYYIKHKTRNGSWKTIAADLSVTEYIHSVGPDSLGMDIYYKVDAAGDGCTNFSDEKIGVANRVCSTAPTNVTATVDNSIITVAWDFTQEGAPATTFNLYRKTDNGAFGLIETEIDINLREFIDSSAKMCEEYSYQVEAINQCGNQNSTSLPSAGAIKPMLFSNVFTYIDGGKNVSYFDASKGYYNQKIILEWQVNPNKKGDIETYEIYRKRGTQPFALLTTINNVNSTYYEDMSSDANTLYEYLIRATGSCSGSKETSDSLFTTGFRSNTGIVSGKVTYDGGNAVENVEVLVNSDEIDFSHSLSFNGISDYLFSTDFSDDSLFHNPLSFDAWIRPENMISGERNVIVSINDILIIGLQNMRPFATLNSNIAGCTLSEDPIASIKADTILNSNRWYHIAVDLNPTNGQLSLYLDGKPIANTTYNNPQTPWAIESVCGVDYESSFVTLGKTSTSDTSNYYKGKLDEVRIWQTSRSANEILQNYTRILSGKEDGLIGYYRLDENFGSAAYDISKHGTFFNKNNFSVPTGFEDLFPEWSSTTPSFEQLHPSGITDQNGNYTVEGIRYAGSGSIFQVTPMLGIHEFNPTDINLFIGDSEPVHNNTNFIDKSSFRFTGTIYYRNTNFPVENAYIYIDNKQVFDAGGKPIVTNSSGQIDISVPIGEHYIAVKKDKHVFLDNGQWPKPDSLHQYPTFNFQDDVNGITFYDNTTVSLCGRFVGGDVEGNKVIGFNKSVNNIGSGTITLKNEMDYDIDFSANGIDTAKVSVKTNAESGEYTIELLPEKYTIVSVENDKYSIDNLELGILDLTDIPSATTVTDTTYNEKIEDEDTIRETIVNEYTYHFERNFIVYSEPVISVFGTDNNKLSGDSEIIIKNTETEENDTIDIANKSPFNHPVFTMAKVYDIDIRVNEVYENNDGENPVYDTVPVKNAAVTIVNNLEIGSPTYNFNTNADGKVEKYTSFRVGLPNMSMDEENKTSFTKTLSIAAQTEHYNTIWQDPATPFRAYTLGGVDAGGANFVTYGPEVTKFILRDPPGSNSYSYIKENSVYSMSQSYNSSVTKDAKFDNTILMGMKFEIGGGLAGPVVSSEVLSTTDIGFNVHSYVDNNGEYRKTYEFTERFSTSSSPDAVGSMADVYIGESQNMFYTETKNLRILPLSFCIENDLTHMGVIELVNDTVEYTLGILGGFAVTEDASSTTFIYTQDHILNTLLPGYKDLIYTLLASSNYESKVPSDHLYYGLNNDNDAWRDSKTWLADSLHPSYEYLGDNMDSVAFLNEQIQVWIQTIARNEAEKVAANNEVIDNISFDGGAGEYMNETKYTEMENKGHEYSKSFKYFVDAETGFTINKTGIIINSYSSGDYELGLSENSSKEKSVTWGYVLSDSEAGDFFSVDVVKNKDAIVEADLDNFLNLDNYEEAGNNLDKIASISAIGGIGALITGKVLTKLINPLAGQAVGMGYTLAATAVYMKAMNHYRKDISSETATFGLEYSSPIFSVKGGQSRCPYEGPDYSLFYYNKKEPYQLSVGTQNHEAPAIAVEPGVVVNVPDGSEAVFDIKLTNESPTGADLAYEMQINEASNPNGAVIKIDGLNPNRTFFIPAGQTLTKTLTVERGASGEMDFEGLELILHSACQYNPEDNVPDIADTVSFDVHFIPTCTNVEFGNITEDWVLNVASKDTLPVNITGYNINQETFDKIVFQYSQSGSDPSTAMTIYKDSTGWSKVPEPKMYLNGKADIDFDFSVDALTDGKYNLHLTSVCTDGSITEADKLQGTIDRINPRLYGTPSPADGVLSAGENIGTKFNETIDEGDLYVHADYISVRGILNGTDLIDHENLLHDVSLHFDGEDDNALVKNGINLNHTSFTIEFWAKRETSGKECMLSLGTPSQGGLKIGFDANNKFTVELGNELLVSDNAYDNITDQWAHYAISYNLGNEKVAEGLTAIISVDASVEEKYVAINATPALEGELSVGYCTEDGSAFTGNIHELRIWNHYRTRVEIAPLKSVVLNGYEQGLYGLWPMNSAFGSIAEDIAHGRNAIVNATWQVSRNGKAISINNSNYAQIPSGSMVYNDEDDFSIEFWFKTDTPSENACLLSNGKANNDAFPNAWTITATANQQLVISNNKVDLSIDAENYLNNNWHHFAMTIDRVGYLTVLLDGEVVKTTASSQFAGFGATQIVLGAKWWNESQIDHYEEYFTGTIDEVRIWNSARTKDQIQRYMNHSLKGDEYGLKAYFPFEDVTISDPSISNITLQNLSQDTIAVAGKATMSAEFTNESPCIKLQRPEVGIPFTYVINNDELIITPDIDDAKIENQILDIAIKKVKDLNNNRLSSTISWSAFIDQNQVVWDIQKLVVEKVIDEELTLSATITNKSGSNETFNITNIPTWMEVSPSEGTLSPLESQEVTITITPELNIGQYNRDINLVSSMGFNERISLSIKVEGNEPDWSVNTDEFEYSASIIGQLSINNIISTDTDDKVACFINGECCGVANVAYFETGNMHLVFIDVYDNDISGNEIEFKVYDASTGEIYADVAPALAFKADSLYGTIQTPIAINSTNNIEQIIELNKGWNWVSYNTTIPATTNANMLLQNMSAHSGDQIKEQNGLYSQFAGNTANSWVGTLQSFSNKSMYKLYANEAQKLVVMGEKTELSSIKIDINRDWNWIAYPASKQMSVKEAMSSLSSTGGDMLKSQKGFAVYDSLLGWVGSLSYLQPGEGYMLHAANQGTLTYPQPSNLKSDYTEDSFNTELQYSSNMTVIGALETNNLISVSSSDVVYAYANGKLRGQGKAVAIDGEYLFFVLLDGDQTADNLTFELQTTENPQTYSLNEHIVFESDAQFGSVSTPYQFSLSATNIKTVGDIGTLSVSPNPCIDNVTFTIPYTNKAKATIEIYNNMSQLICIIPVTGKNTLEWNSSNLTPGVYYAKYISENRSQTTTIIKSK